MPGPDLTPPPPHVLREYAFIADGERGALVGPHGDVRWLCFPQWDSEAVFAALIGGGGQYTVTPLEPFVWGGYYEPGSLIWHSRWVTAGGALVECREALLLPASPDAAVLLRRVACIKGSVPIGIALDVRAGYGRRPTEDLRRIDAGRWRGRSGDVRWLWQSGEGPRPRRRGEGKTLLAELVLAEGDQHDLVLTLARREPQPVEPDVAWQATEAAWKDRIPPLQDTCTPQDARQAYAVLGGLTAGSGAMVAAATTSLPERVQGGRNYDYRYAWVRDQCYAGQAAAAAGADLLLDAAVRFVGSRLLADGPGLRPAYTVRGGRVPPERRMRLSGYPGGQDVIGNHVTDQFQLDAFGEALLLFAAAAARDRLDADAWSAARLAARVIEQRWREPDAGIWEMDARPWTHSRLICAAGLRTLAGCPQAGRSAAHWTSLADTIVARTAAGALHPSGRWQASELDQGADAALVIPAVRGAIPAGDPRTRETLRAVTAELSVDGYVYRNRAEGRPLGSGEGAFLLCGFWLALAWAQQGDLVSAVRWFERNRAACGSPGLYAEEYDVSQRQLRGNLPQAFCHALVLECAARLAGAGVGRLGA
ncbi:MAG: glycoside hydrolase family 15 protein [Candidatus Dormibacteraeota bacterium]|nr:glycoside hydrolase family 15 protein [Candidatus Dormibacteraeota bacterium]